MTSLKTFMKIKLVNNNQPFEDRSELLFAQMNFIAMANKQALHLI